MSEQSFSVALTEKIPVSERVFRNVQYFMLTSTTEVTLEWALCNAHTLTNFQSAWACEEDAPTTQRRHVHVVVALTQRTDLGGRVLKQITKHHPHFTRLRRELDFKKAVKYTLKPNTKVFAELHASRDFEHYFRGVMDNFLRRRAERMQPLCVARGWKNVYAIDYLNWCRIIGRTQDFPEVLRLTIL